MCQFVRGVLLFSVLAGAGCAIPAQDLKCEPIKLELCTHYNSTGMPNFMGHQLQVLVITDIHECQISHKD